MALSEVNERVITMRGKLIEHRYTRRPRQLDPGRDW